MDNSGYCLSILLCLLDDEVVCSTLLDTNIETSLSYVRNLLSDEIGCCHRILLVPECYINIILGGADSDVDISVSEDKEIKLPLMTLFHCLSIGY